MKRKKLILIALLGCTLVLAGVILPDFFKAMNHARQTRTMADIRTIATAWEARADDIGSYSVAAGQHVTAADLARALEPKYVRKLPRTDGWGTELQFAVLDYDAKGHAQSYVIRSLGSDARPDRIANLASGITKDFADDIIYSNGSFIRYPENAG